MFILKTKVNKDSGKFLGWDKSGCGAGCPGTVKREFDVVSLLVLSFIFSNLTQILDTHLFGSRQLSTSCVPVCSGKQAAGSYALSELCFLGGKAVNKPSPVLSASQRKDTD